MSDFIYIKNKPDDIGDQYDFYMAFSGTTPVADPTNVSQWNTFFGTTNLSAVTDISDANLKRYYFSGACALSDQFGYVTDHNLVEYVNKITPNDQFGQGDETVGYVHGCYLFSAQTKMRYIRIDKLESIGPGLTASSTIPLKVYFPNIKRVWDTFTRGGLVITSPDTCHYCFPQVSAITGGFTFLSNVKELHFENLVTVNATQTFGWCPNLTSFIAPKMTTLIGDGAFNEAPLVNLDLSSVTTWGTNVFDGVTGNVINLKMLQSQSGNTNITYLTTNNTVNFTWA